MQTFRKLALVLAFLVCASHGKRVQAAGEAVQGDEEGVRQIWVNPVKSLALRVFRRAGAGDGLATSSSAGIARRPMMMLADRKRVSSLEGARGWLDANSSAGMARGRLPIMDDRKAIIGGNGKSDPDRLITVNNIVGKFMNTQFYKARRGVVLGAAAFAAALSKRSPAGADVESQILRYDEQGRLLDDYTEVTQFRELRSGPASLRLLAAWTPLDDGSYDDPTLGSVISGISITSIETEAPDTAALGRPERVDIVRVLKLEPELQRADLVAAAVRKSDGVTFYDFDLALSPKECGRELASACLPYKVVLLSCGVRDGILYVARVDANLAQWKRAGTALRNTRSTLAVSATTTTSTTMTTTDEVMAPPAEIEK